MTALPIRVRSVGTALPGPPVDTATLGAHLGLDTDRVRWIDATLGIQTRHLSVSLDGTAPPQSMTDLVTTAAAQALDRAAVSPGQVDAVILATGAPDQLMPATVNLVADRLRIDGVPSYQLQSGATGAIQAIELAGFLLSTARARLVLVAAGDCSAKQLDLSRGLAPDAGAAQLDAATFGDAAAAAVISGPMWPAPLTVHSVRHQRVGAGRRPGQSADWAGVAARRSVTTSVTHDRTAILSTVPDIAAAMLSDLLDDTGWDRDEIRLLPPQLWGRLADETAQQLGVPARRCISPVARTGAAANALPLLQLATAMTKLDRDERAVGIAVDPSGWVAAGIAVAHD